MWKEKSGETNSVEEKVCTFYGKLEDSHLAGKNQTKPSLLRRRYILIKDGFDISSFTKCQCTGVGRSFIPFLEIRFVLAVLLTSVTFSGVTSSDQRGHDWKKLVEGKVVHRIPICCKVEKHHPRWMKKPDF